MTPVQKKHIGYGACPVQDDYDMQFHVAFKLKINDP
jgi:hypothetical protein